MKMHTCIDKNISKIAGVGLCRLEGCNRISSTQISTLGVKIRS